MSLYFSWLSQFVPLWLRLKKVQLYACLGNSAKISSHQISIKESEHPKRDLFHADVLDIVFGKICILNIFDLT